MEEVFIRDNYLPRKWSNSNLPLFGNGSTIGAVWCRECSPNPAHLATWQVFHHVERFRKRFTLLRKTSTLEPCQGKMCRVWTTFRTPNRAYSRTIPKPVADSIGPFPWKIVVRMEIPLHTAAPRAPTRKSEHLNPLKFRHPLKTNTRSLVKRACLALSVSII